MVSNPKSDDDDRSNLNERLRSLKIDRAPTAAPTARNGAPKLVLLSIAGFVALLGLGYVFFLREVNPFRLVLFEWKLEVRRRARVFYQPLVTSWRITRLQSALK